MRPQILNKNSTVVGVFAFFVETQAACERRKGFIYRRREGGLSVGKEKAVHIYEKRRGFIRRSGEGVHIKEC